MNKVANLILSKVQVTLKKRQLLPKKSRVLIAVSGGQDSLCLGKILSQLQKKWDWSLAIAHCDHQWEADEGIADHVEKFALNLQLPFYLKTAKNLKETENEARKWRYKALIEMAKEQNCKYIVTAHTKSDRAETFLYNLIRGSGSDGLRSMNWERELDKDIYLVRPLLEITRSETLQFCQVLNLEIWEDVYNQNLKYARNRIRQELIPYLKEHFNIQIEEHLTQTAELLKEDVELLEIMGKELLERALIKEENKINRQVLKTAPIALQRRAIRQYLVLKLPKMPNFQDVEKVRSLINAGNHSQTDPLPSGIMAIVEGEWIIFSE